VRLVDDLLDVGRISAGKIELHLEPVNLSTGWNQESDRALTRQAGFDCHSSKPINPAFLSEFVAKLEPLPDHQS
jgi:hypothetical protein